MVANGGGFQARSDGRRDFRRKNDIDIAACGNITCAIDLETKMFTSDAIGIFIHKETGFPVQLAEEPGRRDRSAKDAEARRVLRHLRRIATNGIEPANS